MPGDAKKGRWVSNLVGLEVLTASPVAPAVPEPGTRALFGVALLVYGAARWPGAGRGVSRPAARGIGRAGRA